MTERKEKITEYMKKRKFDLEVKIKKVVDDRSEVFKEWEKYGLITKDEFIEALKWLCDDPLNEDRELTRRIGLEVTRDMDQKMIKEENPKFYLGHYENNLKGKIIKLKQVYDFRGKFVGLYKVDDNMLWSGNGRRKISIDPMKMV